MSSTAFVWAVFILFVVLILLEVPIPFAMLGSSLLFAVRHHESFVMFAQKTANSFADYSLLAVPAFMFVGCAMNEIGFSDRIFDVAKKGIGHIPGGLGHANILASMIFAGMSGSAMADAGGLGAIEVKAMRDAGYDENFSVAVTAASSSIGPIIPPSINFVVWGFIAQCSTLSLFLAGVLPGILMGVSMMIYTYVAVKYLHVKAPLYRKATAKEFLHSLWRGLPALGAPAILIGGIMSGIFTPTECGVVGCVYVVILAFCYKKMSFKTAWTILKNTLSTTAMTMFLCATGAVFNWMIITSGLMDQLSSLLLMIPNAYIVMLLLNLILLLMGCFMGSMSVLIMMAPLLINLANALGLSLVHIGVVAVLNLTIGLITPPMAPALFIAAKTAGVSFDKALKQTLPFLIPLVITLLLITFIPDIVLCIPKLMKVAV